jgi:hypothetical protein
MIRIGCLVGAVLLSGATQAMAQCTPTGLGCGYGSDWPSTLGLPVPNDLVNRQLPHPLPLAGNGSFAVVTDPTDHIDFSISDSGVIHLGPGVTLRDLGEPCPSDQHEITALADGQAICKKDQS